MSRETQPLLVTGGAGFIGSCFARTWLAEGRGPLVNLDKLTYAGHRASLAEATDDPRHLFVEGDIGDLPLVRRLLAEHRPRGVVHLAAESHVDRSIDAALPFVETNVLGTCRMLESVLDYWLGLPADERDAFRFLHVSTDEVFGSAEGERLFRESDPYRPTSPYAASKAAADHFVRAWHRTYGLPTIVTASSNNYGPYQLPEKLIPRTIHEALAGRPLPVYGDGRQVRDWLHVADHVQALMLLIDRGRPGESYLVGGGSRQTNLHVVETICDHVDALRPDLPHLPCRDLIAHVADRPGHDVRYAIDSQKITEQLGWRPERPFDEGLRETVTWYLNHADWVRQVTDRSDAARRLGLPRLPVHESP